MPDRSKERRRDDGPGKASRAAANLEDKQEPVQDRNENKHDMRKDSRAFGLKTEFQGPKKQEKRHGGAK